MTPIIYVTTEDTFGMPPGTYGKIPRFGAGFDNPASFITDTVGITLDSGYTVEISKIRPFNTFVRFVLTDLLELEFEFGALD